MKSDHQQPKKVRELIGISQLQAAVLANVSQNTYRLYESDPSAVTGRKRVQCDAVVDAMKRHLRVG